MHEKGVVKRDPPLERNATQGRKHRPDSGEWFRQSANYERTTKKAAQV